MEHPLDIKFNIPETTLQSLFGAYKSEETADEIIEEIRESKVFNHTIETLWGSMKIVKNTCDRNNRDDFKALLLNGPTFSKKQLDDIAKTRKAINQWRKK